MIFFKVEKQKTIIVYGYFNLISEKLICEQMNVALIDILGDKIQSRSWLLKKL